MTLKRATEALAAGQFSHSQYGSLELFDSVRHLYFPLVHIVGSAVKVKPVALNADEMRFVKDVAAYCLGKKEQLGGREVYLLRNLSRGKGVGYFEAGNFYLDFIL
jgi:hypothetical protein